MIVALFRKENTFNNLRKKFGTDLVDSIIQGSHRICHKIQRVFEGAFKEILPKMKDKIS